MLNVVLLEGRLVKDPELKKANTGTAYTNVTLAVDNNDKDKTSSFIDCVVWSKSAEAMCKYNKKGDMISARGTLVQRKYQNKDGTQVSRIEIIILEWYFVAGKKNSTNEQAQTSSTSTTNQVSDSLNDIDNDLPF
jgi:single-strand DNA-binding protein